MKKKLKSKKQPEQNTLLSEHFYTINPEDNGGECLMLTTQFVATGDPITKDTGVFLNQQLTLQSYCNDASIGLFGTALTPEKLRELANQLEIERNKLGA
jgi:hypothetical protein